MVHALASLFRFLAFLLLFLFAVLHFVAHESATLSIRRDFLRLLLLLLALDILSLATRRFEPSRRGLSLGELLAVVVVLLSIFLLGVEMFNMLHIFPLKLQR